MKATVTHAMPSHRSRFQSIGPSSVNMRTFFSTIVQSDIISFMMAMMPIGSAIKPRSRAPDRKSENVTGYERKKSAMLPT